MKLICGLGNPGREYERHRHNIGFRVVETLAAKLGASFHQEKFKARIATAGLDGDKLLLLLPQTFMNLSGESVAQAARFFKVEPTDTLVVHDEVDLPFGRLQLKKGGGTGGHNGLRSIVSAWGTEDFDRLRFGVGKPEGPNAKDRVPGWVLSGFTAEEERQVPDQIDVCVQAAEVWAKNGMAAAMNRFNRR